jgi:hypothetical protein
MVWKLAFVWDSLRIRFIFVGSRSGFPAHPIFFPAQPFEIPCATNLFSCAAVRDSLRSQFIFLRSRSGCLCSLLFSLCSSSTSF